MAGNEEQERRIHYPPILNGIDYLRDVVDRLAGESGAPNLRDLKYAVLHLQAASEVLLKARLSQHDWTLVYADPEEADEKGYRAGEFESAKAQQTVDRLRDLVKIPISHGDWLHVRELASDRNKLQHWGLTAAANAVLTRAANVLDFLIRFLDDHLLPELKADDTEAVTDDLEVIRRGLARIESYVNQRMTRLKKAELNGKKAQERTVRCPDCQQLALILDGEKSRCVFCPRDWADVMELALSYDATFGEFTAPGDPHEDILVECPDCGGQQTLFLGVERASRSRKYVNLCFSCQEIFNELTRCPECRRYREPLDDEDVEAMCVDCFPNCA
ncbi:hypothetical protein [Streptomyces sp. NPDC002250]|uniref:hypothetical protein n=1 Tax=Streptomyces sp. NPDC002250 TaxID=3364641 RepID=UPI00369A3AA6